jgi:hypothetical protein
VRERLRDWWLTLKDSRLTAERVKSFATADVLVVSYTKSGRTWLRVLLSNYYSRRFGLSDKELIDGGNFHRQRADIPKIFFAPDTRFPYPELGPPKVHARAHQKIVFLVRDPRDVAVSLYFHVRSRAGERELRRKKIPLGARELDIDSFVLDPSFGAARMIGYLNRWAEERRTLAQAHLLRYEDLRADTEATFADLLAFIGETVDPAQVSETVRFASFQSLQQKEREGYFNSDRLGQTRAGDAETAKVREGRVGGYRSSLRPETADRLDRLVVERLAPDFGYR